MEKYKRNPNSKCMVCANPIYRRPIELKRNGGRVYCSMLCYGISSRKEAPCVVCGKLILASLHKKTCSRSCSNTYRAGIKYKIGRPRDKEQTLRILKLKLMEKRGRKCERCDYNKYEVLQVHHKNRNRNDNTDDNLEIVCPNCHYEEHFLKKSWLNK